MTKSRLFLYSCLVFSAGVAAANWLKADWVIMGTVAGLLVALGLRTGKNKELKLFIYFWLMAFLGLAYASWLGQNNLIRGEFLRTLAGWLTSCRIGVENLNLKMLAEPYASLLNGILLGTKAGIGHDLTKAFKATGLTHIIAISGYNVTIILNSFYIMARGLPYKLRMGVGLALIGGFVILTGGSASVVRAGVMGGLVIIARLFGRKAMALNALVFAAILMILEKPAILVNDIGFQLSVAATLGLVIINPILTKRAGERGVVKHLSENIREALFSTLAAQATTMPIILYYFKNVSLVSPLANVLILPAMPMVMAMGFAGIFLGLAYFPLGYIMSLGTWVPLFASVWLIEKMATIPYASVILPDWVKMLILPYYLGLFYWVFRTNLLEKKKAEKLSF